MSEPAAVEAGSSFGDGAPVSVGGSLRRQLEDTLAANRKLREQLMERVLRDHPGVSAADLDDADPHEFEAVASRIVEQRDAEREDVLRQALAERGLDGEELALAVDRLAGRAELPAPHVETPQERTASLGQIGAPPARLTAEVLDGGGVGPDRVLNAFRQESRAGRH